MVWLRDILIHGYDRVNIHRVWQVIIKDLPQLKSNFSKFDFLSYPPLFCQQFRLAGEKNA